MFSGIRNLRVLNRFLLQFNTICNCLNGLHSVRNCRCPSEPLSWSSKCLAQWPQHYQRSPYRARPRVSRFDTIHTRHFNHLYPILLKCTFLACCVPLLHVGWFKEKHARFGHLTTKPVTAQPDVLDVWIGRVTLVGSSMFPKRASMSWDPFLRRTPPVFLYLQTQLVRGMMPHRFHSSNHTCIWIWLPRMIWWSD